LELGKTWIIKKSKSQRVSLFQFPFLRHFHSYQPVSRPRAVAVRRSFPAIVARGLADARAQREPEITLSGALLSEPGDLDDYPAKLKAAEIIGFLR
jgi:hypothetical protein